MDRREMLEQAKAKCVEAALLVSDAYMGESGYGLAPVGLTSAFHEVQVQLDAELAKLGGSELYGVEGD